MLIGLDITALVGVIIVVLVDLDIVALVGLDIVALVDLGIVALIVLDVVALVGLNIVVLIRLVFGLLLGLHEFLKLAQGDCDSVDQSLERLVLDGSNVQSQSLEDSTDCSNLLRRLRSRILVHSDITILSISFNLTLDCLLLW